MNLESPLKTFSDKENFPNKVPTACTEWLLGVRTGALRTTCAVGYIYVKLY